MLRHKRSVNRPEESENSDTDQSFAEDSDQAESENEETVAKYDPWDSLIQKTIEQCQSQFEAKVDRLTHNRIGQEDARSSNPVEVLLCGTLSKALAKSMTITSVCLWPLFTAPSRLLTKSL